MTVGASPVTVLMTETFTVWLDALHDRQARARVIARVGRLAQGNPGDHHALDGGLIELRIDYGPGYRVYYTQRETTVLLVLCGGDKRRQAQDIARARAIAAEWKAAKKR
ncbi:MAG: type II toxin-antitoxin system RelE/ParE family toxin [Acidobacteria bacterium]|nr:type II toxin-antitoxin system RelE/ParE family toxin [Acidobacteriota bacterium]